VDASVSTNAAHAPESDDKQKYRCVVELKADLDPRWDKRGFESVAPVASPLWRRALTLLSNPGVEITRGGSSLIARGDRFYERYGPVAVLFTPFWIAGIHDMR
jgi:hypothetical protein